MDSANYEKRYGDEEISRCTPYRQVKTILLKRFHRRLEEEQSLTVPGRILDTVQAEYPPPLSKHCYSREREISKTGRSIRERNKTKMHTF
jgi:hypothetical protein